MDKKKIRKIHHRERFASRKLSIITFFWNPWKKQTKSFSITSGSYGLTWPDRKDLFVQPHRQWKDLENDDWSWWNRLGGVTSSASIVRLFTIIKGYERLRSIELLPYKAISSATFEFRALSVTSQIDFSWCKQSPPRSKPNDFSRK